MIAIFIELMTHINVGSIILGKILCIYSLIGDFIRFTVSVSTMISPLCLNAALMPLLLCHHLGFHSSSCRQKASNYFSCLMSKIENFISAPLYRIIDEEGHQYCLGRN